MNILNKAVFLDRDGVIIEDVNYIKDPDQVKIIENSDKAINMLNEAGYKVIVVTNQSGIARGYFNLDDYKNVTKRIKYLLSKVDATIDLILFSPYHIDGIIKEYAKDSPCRKPSSGMFLKAKEKLNIDFSLSWMIGDKASDIKAGKNLKIKTILVKTGYGENKENPDFICENLYEAVKLIIEKDKNEG